MWTQGVGLPQREEPPPPVLLDFDFGRYLMIPSFPLLGRTFTIYPLMALVGMFVSGIYACRAE